MILSMLRHCAVRKRALSALSNEESLKVVVCVSGITRRGYSSCCLQVKG